MHRQPKKYLYFGSVPGFKQFFQKRCVSLAKQKNKVTSKDKALIHFDDFYGNIFAKKWPSIRLALLSTQKYIAVVNNFSDSDRTKSDLENLGSININKILEVQSQKLDTSKDIRKKLDYSWNVATKLQKFSEQKQDEEIFALYPTSEELNSPHIPAEKNDLASDERLIEPSLGMTSPALSQYVPATIVKGADDWVPESQHYSYYNLDNDDRLTIIEEESLQFPLHLHAYIFEMGNTEQFPHPKKGTTNVSDYYLMNGGSLFPVLALNLMPGDTLLDMCAAPGGKSLLGLQTLYPLTVVLNDISLSRVNKIKKVMKEFLYDFDERIRKEEIIITNIDGRLIDMENTFNKILVDVPCTTDRVSLMEDDNNIFQSTRVKERIRIPELQSELLGNALKLIKVGGTVVYSTCTLSPTQNDGVVALALRTTSQQTGFEYAIIDMNKALEPLGILFPFGTDIGLKCGHLIVPYLPSNFGPSYFCKIVRVK